MSKIKKRKIFFSNFKKSQSSLELISTYGWAFVVMIAIIAALAFFGVVSPRNLIPNRCNFGAEFACVNYLLGQTDVGTGVLRLRLRNNLNQPVLVDKWTTSSESSIPFSCEAKPVSGVWLTRETKDFEFTGCNNKDAGLIIGEKGKVQVNLNYHFAKSSLAYVKPVNGEVLSTITRVEGLLTKTQCNDGIDNDNNGCIDFIGGDGGCSSDSDTTENGGGCLGQPLICSVNSQCTYTTVFRLADLKDTHAQIPGLSDYNYAVCCRSVDDTLSTSCTNPDAVLLHLSGNSDAHAEKNTQSNYNVNVCLSADKKNLLCRYSANGCENATNEVCLATISADTDANVGDCTTQPFATRICCRML